MSKAVKFQYFVNDTAARKSTIEKLPNETRRNTGRDRDLAKAETRTSRSRNCILDASLRSEISRHVREKNSARLKMKLKCN